MKLETVTKDIINWITTVVEVPRDELNGRSVCPFAQQSRLNSTFDIRIGTSVQQDLERILDRGLEGKEVIVLAYSPDQYTPVAFDQEVTVANDAFLGPHDLIALTDHPEDLEEIQGIVVNQGQYALIFVQQLSKLNQASHVLARQGFYQGWSPEYLRDLFRFRKAPEQLDIEL